MKSLQIFVILLLCNISFEKYFYREKSLNHTSVNKLDSKLFKKQGTVRNLVENEVEKKNEVLVADPINTENTKLNNSLQSESNSHEEEEESIEEINSEEEGIEKINIIPEKAIGLNIYLLKEPDSIDNDKISELSIEGNKEIEIKNTLEVNNEINPITNETAKIDNNFILGKNENVNLDLQDPEKLKDVGPETNMEEDLENINKTPIKDLNNGLGDLKKGEVKQDAIINQEQSKILESFFNKKISILLVFTFIAF